VPLELPRRPLIFVAHPDDETIACGGLLQRLPVSLVVFATDGAPPGCGLERRFGSLNAYAELRIQEVARVLERVPTSSFKRLARPDGSHFSDQHLFEELPDAAVSLRAIAQSFSPDAIISHTYEGAHIDHDTSSFLAMHVAESLSLMRIEFPIYWLDQNGNVVRQKFRNQHAPTAEAGLENDATDATELQLTEAEIECKKKMLSEYVTQCDTVATFAPGTERFRRATNTTASFSVAQCRSYMFQERQPRWYHTRHHRLPANVLLKKFAEFENWRQQQEEWRSSP
jgi:N-acetylglucosamine malate deacetylase 2